MSESRQEEVAPERCPGATCTLGRTQDWITGAGKIDDRFSDLPPGHFWYRDGDYLAHQMSASGSGQAATHPDGYGDTAACKHCHRPIARCASLAGHAGCRSGYGWIHSDPKQWEHSCQPRSSAPYALPEPTGGAK